MAYNKEIEFCLNPGEIGGDWGSSSEIFDLFQNSLTRILYLIQNNTGNVPESIQYIESIDQLGHSCKISNNLIVTK